MDKREISSEELIQFICEFVDVVLNHREGSKIAHLQQKYNGTNIRVNYYKNYGGSSIFKDKPTFTFLIDGQTVKKGIYPIIHLDRTNDKNNFNISYGISWANKPDMMWSPNILQKGVPNNDKSLYSTLDLTVHSKDDIMHNKDVILKTINYMIIDYKNQLGNKFGNKNSTDKNFSEQKHVVSSLNQILYGPPGTGKTYNTVVKAMEIIDNKKYTDDKGNLLDEYNYNDLKKKFDNCKKDGQIEFITFHQSYSYEEFVEGIKPYIPEWGKNNVQDVKYIGKDGIFKRICEIAKIASDNFDIFFSNLKNYLKDNSLNLLLDDKTTKITIENAPNAESIKIIPHTEKATANYVQKSELQNPENMNGREGYAKAILNLMHAKYVLIIDEINRGNISKIFGELITLIEEDKRAGEDNAITVTLPYSGELFSVPNNLYIIGTMNSADRSIALLDTALRRRFDFVEMMPQEELIESVQPNEIARKYKLSTFLKNLNDKISSILDDDNYKIGHAYLMKLSSENDLERAICNKIFPLLQEYFYNEKKDLKDVVGYCSLSDLKKNKNWEKVISKYSEQRDDSN